MSFWGGMARGFKDASEKKERDQAVERQEERLAIEDARYQSEVERADRYRSEDIDFRMKEFKARQEQQAFDRQMATNADTRAQEAVIIDRYTKMAELIPDGLKAAYSGEDPAKVSKIGSTVMSDKGIFTGSLVFEQKYNELSDDEKNSDVMKMIKEDKAVQAQFAAFLEAQVDIGNKATLQDFIKYHEYAGTIQGNTDSPEYQEALTLLATGEGMDNPEKFAKAYITLKNGKNTRHVFVQTGTPSKLGDYDKEMKMWEADTLIEANIAVANMPEGPKKQEIIQTLALTKEEATRYKGLVALAGKYGFGEGALDKYNLRENSTLSSLYPSGDAAGTTPGAGTGTAPGVGTGTPPVGTDPSASSGQLTSFATPQELSDAIGNGFSGRAEVGGETFIVGGQSYNVEPAGDPEGLTQGSVEPEGEAFRSAGGLTDLLDGKDGNLAEYGALREAMMALPEEDRSAFVEEYSRLETVAPLADAVRAAGEATGVAVDRALGFGIGGAEYAVGAFASGLGTAYNYLTGDTVGATKQSLRGKRTKDEAKELMAEGIVSRLDRGLAEMEPMKRSELLAVPDDSMDAKSERSFGKTDYMSGLMGPSDSTPSTQEAPEEGYKPTDMGATELNNPKVREQFKTAIKESDVVDKAVEDLIGLAERVADSDRQFANDERNYPQPLDAPMSAAQDPEDAALFEKVAAVEEDLFDLGVSQPTNMKELASFMAELDGITSDLEIQIEPEVLQALINSVTARVTGAGMNWGNRRGRVLSTPDDELDARARRNTGKSGDRGPLPRKVKEEEMDWSNRRGRVLDTPNDKLDARARRNTGRSR